MPKEQTSADVATVASRIMRTAPAAGQVMGGVYNLLLDDAKSVAASALTQREGTESITESAKTREAVPAAVISHPPMTFGEAIAALKRGEKVCRFGWSEKETWIEQHSDFTVGVRMTLRCRRSDGVTVREPWLPNFNDIFAEDWVNLTFPKSDKDMGGGVVEANFGFYVDGWTLRSTENVGEVYAVRMDDGAHTTFNSASLVAFLARRLDLPVIER